ncbi:MAG TPA: hypothetical protein VFF12_09530 [Myxococcaceae bacterium]|nr:hypothetical protein [Myxococcaceae bacterium]
MRRNALWTVGLLILGLLACGENLEPVKAAWATVSGTITTRVGEWKKSQGEAQAALKALPALAPTDMAGHAMRKQLDGTLAREAKAIADAESLISAGRASYGQALGTRKVANVQKVIDDNNARFTALEKTFSDSSAQSSALLARLGAHAEQAPSPAGASAGR